MDLRSAILKSAEKHFDAVVAMRRHLHKFPELSKQEAQTSAHLREALAPLEMKLKSGIAGHGFTLDLIGSGEGKHIALRADMDALPIQEQSEKDYQSVHEGIMHACGHDAHSAMLYGVALILNDIREQLSGRIRFIFQPSEEQVPSGAEAMIAAGVLEDPTVDAAFALHVTPELESGKLGFRPGPFMASADEIYITVHGKGGHGASPHKLVDPILISAHLIIALQNMISREIDPQVPAVLSFGDIRGFGATNIIPNEVKLKGTFRCFDEDIRSQVIGRIKELSDQLCRSMGARAEVNIPEGVPHLRNNEFLTVKAKRMAADLLGQDAVTEMPLRMGGEDFAHFSRHLPACLIRLGTGNKNLGTDIGLHQPQFDIDEEAMKLGMAALAYIAASSAADIRKA